MSGENSATLQNDSGEAINKVPPESLAPYVNNSRTHSDEQIAQVMASIEEFGFTSPILTHKDIGVVAGHARLQAALRAGLPEVPTIALDHLTPDQARAYVIADNQLSLNAGWDPEILAFELDALKGIDFDLSVLGFAPLDLRDILGDEPELHEMPALPNGERAPFQQMTFTVHDDQIEPIKAALTRARAAGPFDGPNENSNGNALARVCEAFGGR